MSGAHHADDPGLEGLRHGGGAGESHGGRVRGSDGEVWGQMVNDLLVYVVTASVSPSRHR